MKRILTVVLLAGVVVAAATTTAGADCGSSHAHGISTTATATASAKAPADVVLHIRTGPGAFSPAGPEVTVHADGRVFLEGGSDGRERIELTIPVEAVQHLLDDAKSAGALRDFDYGDADITDQGTTTIEVRHGARHRKQAIYALVFSGAGYSSGDHPLTAEQIEARSRLGRFVLDASDPETYTRWETIEHPTGADEVVFRTVTERNGWGGEYPKAVTVAIYGDGRVVYGGGQEERWTERRLQRFLRDARRIGLLGDAEYGEAMVTDQGTTHVELHAGGLDRVLAIYALELPQGDRGLPEGQRQARRDLRALLHSLAP